jgi:hypothetical protein
MDNIYIRIGTYNGQDVYYSAFDNQVAIEKDHQYLVLPDAKERKDLIDFGLIKIVNKILEGEEALK